MIGVGTGGPGRDSGSEADARPAAEPDGGIPAEERSAIAVLVSVEHVGPITLSRLIRACGSAASVLGLVSEPNGPQRLVAAVAASTPPDEPRLPLAAALASAIGDAAATAPVILDRVRALGLRLVVPTDRDYPARLRAIELPPALLFVRGDPACFQADDAVAVVGTRRPTDAGRRIATRIGAALARAGALVVSGLAVGIDGATHAAVVDEGGRTAAFIGGGHGRLFPAAHDRLAEVIDRSGGAIVSEYAPDTSPTKGTFPRRNRLISGAADAVVVVEAGARSGALLTASWALEQGRECFLVPGSIEAPMSAGCLGFLRDWPGAARIVSGIPQLLDDLGLPADAALPPRQLTTWPGPSASVRRPSAAAAVASLDARDQPVARALLAGHHTVDELVATTRLTVAAVLGSLTRLESASLVHERHGRYVGLNGLERAATRTRPAA